MSESLVELVRVLRAALASFDPGVYSGEDCAVLVEELAAVEKVSAAARVRAAARAGECGVQEQARAWRLRAIDPEELHALQHAAMHHIPFANRLDAETDRLWLTAHRDATRQNAAAQQDLSDSASDAVNVEVCAGVDNSGAGGSSAGGLGGRTELRRSALAAQAFVRMMENGGGKGKANRADLMIVCDLRAYQRGHAHAGEPCHIVGGGPIPVSLAKELGRDAFLKAVLHDGTEIHTIAHFGRKSPAVLRTPVP